MSEKNFFDGKKTYIGAIIATIVMIAPDFQELLAVEGEWTTFNFWIPAAKLAIGAFTIFGRHMAGVRIETEVNSERDLEVDALKAEIKTKAGA